MSKETGSADTPPTRGASEAVRSGIDTISAEIDAVEGLGTFFRNYAGLLSDRISVAGEEGIDSAQFVAACMTLAYDCATGVNGLTGEPMPDEVLGKPEMWYSVANSHLLVLAGNTIGEDFAAEVFEIWSS